MKKENYYRVETQILNNDLFWGRRRGLDVGNRPSLDGNGRACVTGGATASTSKKGTLLLFSALSGGIYGSTIIIL